MITHIDINGFIAGYPRAIANEALYYCIRALKQANLPAASKKDYFHDTSGSRPSGEAVALTQRILDEIEAIENRALDRIDRPTVHEYITLIARAIGELAASDTSLDLQRGAELLRRMREA